MTTVTVNGWNNFTYNFGLTFLICQHLRYSCKHRLLAYFYTLFRQSMVLFCSQWMVLLNREKQNAYLVPSTGWICLDGTHLIKLNKIMRYIINLLSRLLISWEMTHRRKSPSTIPDSLLFRTSDGDFDTNLEFHIILNNIHMAHGAKDYLGLFGVLWVGYIWLDTKIVFKIKSIFRICRWTNASRKFRWPSMSRARNANGQSIRTTGKCSTMETSAGKRRTRNRNMRNEKCTRYNIV